MFGQLLRGFRRRMFGEIGGTAHDRHAHVRSQGHGDHVLGDLFAQPHAGIEPLRHDVGEAEVHAHFHRDVGIVRQKFCQGGKQDLLGRMLAGGDADHACRLFAQFAQRRELAVDLRQRRT